MHIYFMSHLLVLVLVLVSRELVLVFVLLQLVLTNQIKKGLLPSLGVKFFFKSVNIWQSYKQERDCLVLFVRLANTLLKRRRKCTKQSRFGL